ncbi:MAG: hypothetical protein ACXVZO_11885, partial [Gaiellaceae bacterium]
MSVFSISGYPPHEASDQLLPDQELPDQLLPDHELPDQLLPDQLLPDQELPDQELPVQVCPFQTPPDHELPVLSAAASDLVSTGAPKTSCSPVSTTPFCVRWSWPRDASSVPLPSELGNSWGRSGRGVAVSTGPSWISP